MNIQKMTLNTLLLVFVSLFIVACGNTGTADKAADTVETMTPEVKAAAATTESTTTQAATAVESTATVITPAPWSARTTATFARTDEIDKEKRHHRSGEAYQKAARCNGYKQPCESGRKGAFGSLG